MKMALPKAVQQQLDAADQIEQAMTGIAETPPPADTIVPTETPPVVEPPKVAPPVSEPVVSPEAYETLKGKYNAEVPRLHAAVNETKAHLEVALRELQELKAKTPEVKAEPPKEPVQITDHDKEVFGEDMIDLATRVARSVVLHEIEGLKALIQSAIKPVEQTVQQVVAKQAFSAEQQYFIDLGSKVSDWETINQDARWVEWLKGRYPGAKESRQISLDKARQALDLAATVEMFQAFKGDIAPVVQQQTTAQSELQSQVAPTKSRSSSIPADTQTKKIWTQAEIAEALDPRALRKMTSEEAGSVIAEIDAASAEGRIRL